MLEIGWLQNYNFNSFIVYFNYIDPLFGSMQLSFDIVVVKKNSGITFVLNVSRA